MSAYFKSMSAYFKSMSAYFKSVSSYFKIMSAYYKTVSAYYKTGSPFYKTRSPFYKIKNSWILARMAPHMGRLYFSENKHLDFSSFFTWDPNWDTYRERVKKTKMWRSRASSPSSGHKATLLSALVILRTFTCKQVTSENGSKLFTQLV